MTDPLPTKPHCINEVLRRIEQGETTKDDADYLLKVLDFASTKIADLEMRVALLQHQLMTLQ